MPTRFRTSRVSAAMILLLAPFAHSHAGQVCDNDRLFVSQFDPAAVPPGHWIVNASQSFESRFSRRFTQGTGGVQQVNVASEANPQSPSGSNNTVFSYAFKVCESADADFGKLGGVTGSLGGTPWFFISEDQPGNLNLLMNNTGAFSYRCATAGTGSFAWMLAGSTLPANANPNASNRCQLIPGQQYYLNIIFYNLSQLINNDNHLSSCVRPLDLPNTWTCFAKFSGGVGL